MQNKKEERSQKFEMIRQWQESGVSQKRFCADNNIAYHAFHYWYRVYREDTGPFLPLNIAPAASQEQIILTGVSGIQLRLSYTDQSVRLIRQLLLS